MMAVLALVVFAAMFLVVFVARSLIQKRRTGDSGIRSGALDANVGSVEWFSAWMFLLAFLCALAAPGAELAGLDPWTTNTWVRSFGAGVAVLGMVMTFVAQLSMGEHWRIGVDVDEQTGLVTAGVFRVVRNPIFSALLLAATGLAIMVPNPISTIGVALFLVAIEMQVRAVEEPHLRRHHGDDYTAYESQVGRLVPLLGRRQS